MTSNFKTYWLDYFEDISLYSINISIDIELETISITSPNNENLSRIELLIYREDDYNRMFSIYFYHPDLKGLSESNAKDNYGIDDWSSDSYTKENLNFLTNRISAFLLYGCKEKVYSYNNRVFKFEFEFPLKNNLHRYNYKPKGDNLNFKLIRVLDSSKIKITTNKIEQWT